jgi:hypothetical protein
LSKLGRNEPCWCGSGKKFKKCHWPHTGPDISSERITEVFGAFGTGPLEQTLRQSLKKDPRAILARIQDEKQKGTRALPSSTLISIGNVPTQAERTFLVDTCACLVDQNPAGRSEMCIYFAVLIRHGLNLLGYPATVELGKARYSMAGQSFEWDHAWVRTQSGDIVDGNIDSMTENPMIPEGIEPKPYWGPPDVLPSDREFYKMRDLPPERDDIELETEVIRQWKADLEREIERTSSYRVVDAKDRRSNA